LGFYTSKTFIMKKLLTPIVCLLLLISCQKDETYIEPIYNYELVIDSVLNRAGTKSLPKDSNGYYHLLINNPYSQQQSHRVVGKFLVNGKVPNYPEKIEWESNLYWLLRRGDTLATITKSYLNYFTGQFTIAKLPPLIASKDELVPTVNKASYSGTKGEINTIISPISRMKGDTRIVKASHYESKKILYTKIILD